MVVPTKLRRWVVAFGVVATGVAGIAFEASRTPAPIEVTSGAGGEGRATSELPTGALEEGVGSTTTSDVAGSSSTTASSSTITSPTTLPRRGPGVKGTPTTPRITSPPSTAPMTEPPGGWPEGPPTPGFQPSLTAVTAAGLYAVDVDGTHLRRLTDSGPSGPAWSPDGRWIAHTSSGSFVDPRTGETRFRTDPAKIMNGSERPAWSPDSRRVAFVGNGDPLTQTFTMGGVSREETTEQRDIWVTTVDGSGPAVRIPYPGDEVGVTWLPNGRIASVAEEGIWTFEADGSDRRHIYAGPMPWVMTRNVGVWASLESSPDGRYLAVLFYNSHENLVVDVDGKNAVIVDDGDRYHWAVADISWSPTGDDYVYACMVDGHPGTRVASSDGKADRLLDPWLGQPAWSPRGDLIAGVDNPAGDLYRDLVTIRPDGSDRRTILTVPPNLKIDHQHSVGWSPDGRSIAFSVGYAYAASVPPGAQPH